MSLKKTALAISLTAVSLFAQAENKKTPFSEQPGIRFEVKEKDIPVSFHQFISLDFDARMELQETMCQLKKTEDFDSLISEGFSKDKKAKLTLPNFNKCNEIVRFGMPLSFIKENPVSLEKTALACGFKRVYGLIQFYNHPHQEQFLKGKNDLYVSSLMAEEQVFEEVLSLFDFDTKEKFWQNFDKELRTYQQNTPKANITPKNYWNNLQKKVKIKLERQKQSLSQTR